MCFTMSSREIVIPAVTLKSGGLRYKKSKQERLKRGIASDSIERLYPKLSEDNIDNDNKSSSGDVTCSLVYEENSHKFYFKIPDKKTMKHSAEIKYIMLECVNITAADIKVTSKYGWESMSCRLLVECNDPLIVWSSQVNPTSQETEYIRTHQESCMVKATFDVTELNKLRHVLHSVKVAQLKERKMAMCDKKNGVARDVIPSKIREGLPEWVNYIPAVWYSSTLRKVIEYLLFVYTLLTLLWAVWQLYKHVDFIRKHLQPLLRLIEFYLEIMKGWFRWLDSIAEVLTSYWWTYMKPIYLLAAPMWSVLSQIFRPLRNIAGIIASLLGPVFHLFGTILSFLKPVFQPVIACFHIVNRGYHRFINAVFNVWYALAETAIIKIVIGKVNEIGFTKMLHDLLHGGLDPIRAQFIVVRDLLLKSVKQIYYGMRFIWTRIYITFLFWKRERQYAKEELTDDDKIKKGD